MSLAGPGANLLTVRRNPAGGTPRFRIFTVNAGETVNISGMTVTGGHTLDFADDPSLGDGVMGGGILNQGTLTLSGVAVNGNRMGKGKDGTDTATSGGPGGGIANDGGTLTLLNCTVSGNQTGDGGVASNNADSDGLGGAGGGIYSKRNTGVAPSATLNITNSTISGNQTGNTSNPNPVGGGGGGIYNDSFSTMTLTGVTVSNNTATTGLGGGIFIVGSASIGGVGSATLRNSIVANNSAPNPGPFPGRPDLGGGLYDSQDYNLIGAASDSGHLRGSTSHNIYGQDPLLGPLQDNRGPTETRALLTNSPAIDKGKSFGSSADQRGQTRPVDLNDATYPNAAGGNASDIGALEAQTLPTADTTPPTVTTITRANTTPNTQNTLVSFTVTFSETVSGVDSSDFVLTTSNLSGAAVTSIFGSGPTRLVTVNTGSLIGGGNGTLRLDVADDDTVVDDSGNPLGGAGNGNGNFTSGESYAINRADQTITFGPLSNKTFGDADFNVSATASSGLGVSFSATGNCTVTGSTVHITGGGSCTITASQAGNNNYNPAPNVQQSFNIAPALTSTALTSSVNPSAIGQSVAFTATVTSTQGGTPTGTVTFKDNGSAISTCTNIALSAGQANCTTSGLTVGLHAMTADYSGDANFNISTGTLTGGQQVNPSISINDISLTEGDAGTKNFSFTVTLAEASNLPVKVDYQTADGTAAAASDYVAASSTLTFNPGELTKTIVVPVNGDGQAEPDEGFFVNLSSPINATISDNQGLGTILNDDGAALQFSSNSYSVNEGAGRATITVTRTGDLSGPSSVRYETSDLSALNNCGVNTGNASQRCDYTAVGGTLNFPAGESSKTFTIPIINDVYVEGPETLTVTLSNQGGGTLGAQSSSTVSVVDDDSTPGALNPIEGREFLIRQFYLDTLNREPEPPGLAAWLDRLNTCPQPGETLQNCDEIEVASAFFRSPEFFDRAYFIYKFYEAALARQPQYDEYQRDLRRMTGFLTTDELEQRKREFAEEFAGRPEFRTLYDSFGSGQPFVDAVLGVAGTARPGVGAAVVVTSNRHSVINRLAAGQITRGQGLRELTESAEISQRFFNKAFVVVGYFAFLRRNPDINYLHWIDVLNMTGDYRDMIRGFLLSAEYRFRFGPM